ncbi:hypothetical protein WUBG_18812 [Wuchereria bancrofti]|uniref:Uncharacterized protein n=1 Tax=Wuchereria bancrofti TaxID=6293 RepID=J9DLD4_WUCBA|nr:hypothetical protein WUBG_18812 [Wuchereria bancrofti]
MAFGALFHPTALKREKCNADYYYVASHHQQDLPAAICRIRFARKTDEGIS